MSDRSASVDAAALERTRGELLRQLADTAGDVTVMELEFGGRAGSLQVPSARTDGMSRARQELEPGATNLAAALQAALSSTRGARPAALVVLSDGLATTGDSRGALEGAAAAGVPVLWRTVPPDAIAPRYN